MKNTGRLSRVMAQESSEQLLTVGDVARRCKVSIGTVYAAITSGRLKATRLGNRKALRIEPHELTKWIQNQHQNNEPQLGNDQTLII